MLKTIIITFWAIFLAELGDKTQLATLAFSVKERPLPVFIGSSLALSFSSLLAVLFGEFLLKTIPFFYIKLFSGILFIAIGIWILIS